MSPPGFEIQNLLEKDFLWVQKTFIGAMHLWANYAQSGIKGFSIPYEPTRI